MVMSTKKKNSVEYAIPREFELKSVTTYLLKPTIPKVDKTGLS